MDMASYIIFFHHSCNPLQKFQFPPKFLQLFSWVTAKWSPVHSRDALALPRDFPSGTAHGASLEPFQENSKRPMVPN